MLAFGAEERVLRCSCSTQRTGQSTLPHMDLENAPWLSLPHVTSALSQTQCVPCRHPLKETNTSRPTASSAGIPLLPRQSTVTQAWSLFQEALGYDKHGNRVITQCESTVIILCRWVPQRQGACLSTSGSPCQALVLKWDRPRNEHRRPQGLRPHHWWTMGTQTWFSGY